MVGVSAIFFTVIFTCTHTLTRNYIGFLRWLKISVVLFNHFYTCSHLFGKRIVLHFFRRSPNYLQRLRRRALPPFPLTLSRLLANFTDAASFLHSMHTRPKAPAPPLSAVSKNPAEALCCCIWCNLVCRSIGLPWHTHGTVATKKIQQCAINHNTYFLLIY